MASNRGQEIDEHVLQGLPSGSVVKGLIKHGSSAWADNYQVDVLHTNSTEESYFMKVSFGHHGREALKGEIEGTKAIHNLAPDLVPKPIAYGTYKEQKDTHFYICKFYELDEQLPDESELCEKLAALHQQHVSPSGKYGFHVTTYNGDLPQDNTFADTWEGFFSNGLKHMFALNRERGGVSEELEALIPELLEKVVPRLLRPLEIGGNPTKPSLVHGDLWCGNAAIDRANKKPIVFDPSSFWAHNECKGTIRFDRRIADFGADELGNWRPERNKFTKRYLDAYHSHFPKAVPEEDYDDRHALYALRFNLHAATLFPDVSEYRKSVIDEARRLILKSPHGLGVGLKPKGPT